MLIEYWKCSISFVAWNLNTKLVIGTIVKHSLKTRNENAELFSFKKWRLSIIEKNTFIHRNIHQLYTQFWTMDVLTNFDNAVHLSTCHIFIHRAGSADSTEEEGKKPQDDIFKFHYHNSLSYSLIPLYQLSLDILHFRVFLQTVDIVLSNTDRGLWLKVCFLFRFSSWNLEFRNSMSKPGSDL